MIEKIIKPMWAHQERVIPQAVMAWNFAFFWEMGTGKSRGLIETLKNIFNSEGRLNRTLIFCPPIVISNWRDEWLQYTRVNPRFVIPLYGSGKKRLELFEKQAFNLGDDQGRIFITNYESLRMEALFKAFCHWRPEVVAFDEAHKLKSHEAQRSKLAYELANPYDYKLKKRLDKPRTIIMTGSPILNTPMDIFQQFKIMDGGETFGYNFYAFQRTYFRDENAGMKGNPNYFPKWVPKTLTKDGFDAQADLNIKIAAKSMRIKKEECLDLPPEVSVIHKCEMSKDQHRLYDEMKREFLTFYESKACVASIAIVKALRLMQITSGYLSAFSPGGEEQREEITLPNIPKREVLKGYLEELCVEQDHQVLVWAVFKKNYETIKEVCAELKIDYREIHGGISESRKRANVAEFKSIPSIRVLIGHPGSGGIGINLVNAPYSIFYSRTFSLEQYLQARARNHRGGAKEAGHEKITHYDLVCENTIDELALGILSNKVEMSEATLRGLVQELKSQNG